MDRTAARNRAELAIEIEQVLDEVRRAVGGWKPILARLRSDTDRIADPQAKAFLEWLAADNFTFLGHAEFRADADSPSDGQGLRRSEEHTSELQSLMRISYAVFCLKKKIKNKKYNIHEESNNDKLLSKSV